VIFRLQNFWHNFKNLQKIIIWTYCNGTFKKISSTLLIFKYWIPGVIKKLQIKLINYTWIHSISGIRKRWKRKKNKKNYCWIRRFDSRITITNTVNFWIRFTNTIKFVFSGFNYNRPFKQLESNPDSNPLGFKSCPTLRHRLR